MDLEPEGIWYAATASFDSRQLEQGYHILEIEATDDEETFEQKFTFKVSDEEITDIGDVLSHIDTYMGKYVTVKGVITAAFKYTPVIQDDTARIHLYAECYQPPTFEMGEMPKPVLKTAFEIDESAEGLLVEVKDATITSVDSSGFTIQDETGEVYVYGKEAGFDTSSLSYGQVVDVIGIGQQYKDMYEITLRNVSEVYVYTV